MISWLKSVFAEVWAVARESVVEVIARGFVDLVQRFIRRVAIAAA